MARELALPAPDRRNLRRAAYALLTFGVSLGGCAAGVVRWAGNLRAAGEASRDVAICGGAGLMSAALVVLGAMTLLARCRAPS